MSNKQRGLASNPLFDKTDDEMTGTKEIHPIEALDPQLDAPPAESTTQVENEMRTPHGTGSVENGSKNPGTEPSEQLAERPPDQLTEPSTDQSTGQPIDLSTRQVMSRPAAFYLFADQSDALDDLVVTLRREHGLLTDLDQGEAEVIVLAQEQYAQLVILDERLARRHTRRLGLSMTGTLGILLRAKERGLVSAIGPLSMIFAKEAFD